MLEEEGLNDCRSSPDSRVTQVQPPSPFPQLSPDNFVPDSPALPSQPAGAPSHHRKLLDSRWEIRWRIPVFTPDFEIEEKMPRHNFHMILWLVSSLATVPPFSESVSLWKALVIMPRYNLTHPTKYNSDNCSKGCRNSKSNGNLVSGTQNYDKHQQSSQQ